MKTKRNKDADAFDQALIQLDSKSQIDPIELHLAAKVMAALTPFAGSDLPTSKYNPNRPGHNWVALKEVLIAIGYLPNVEE